MDLGSCQYDDIGEVLSGLLYEDLSLQLLIRRYSIINFSGIGTWLEHLDGLKIDLRESILHNEIDEDDAEEVLDRENQLGTIQNMYTMDEFFIYACNNSWDLWSACSFMCSRLGIKVDTINITWGLYSDETYGALLYYFHKSGMVTDIGVYDGFDT